MKKDKKLIVGCDEVGLGCIAGPVVAAAVVLPKDYKFEGLRDSKKMKPADREWIAKKIKEQSLWWAIVGSSTEQINKYGISKCRWACCRVGVLRCLSRFPNAKVIIDGNQYIPGVDIKIQSAIPKADDKFQAVSAASVIAKVHRDHMMVKLWEKYPYYDWKKNAGYGTPDHLTSLRKYGVSSQHRKSYGPVKKQLEKQKRSANA